jgi:hypothetical protein
MSDAQARVAELADALEGKTPDQPEADETSAPDDGTGAPEAVEETPEAPEQEAPEAEEDDFDFDLASIPEDADRAWLAKRHKEMQALLTRKTQELAEKRREVEPTLAALNDPSKREALFQKLAEELGYEFAGDEDEDLDDDEFEPDPQQFRDPRLDKLLSDIEAEKAGEAKVAYIEEQFEELETELGSELAEDDIRLIADLAEARAQGGRPDIKGAYKAIVARDKANKKAWLGTKTAAPAPKGERAKHTPDLDTEEARVQWMAEQVDAQSRADT